MRTHSLEFIRDYIASSGETIFLVNECYITCLGRGAKSDEMAKWLKVVRTHGIKAVRDGIAALDEARGRH